MNPAMPELSIEKHVSYSYDETLQRTRDALQKEGFGVLTEIDVAKTLKQKIDVDFRRYMILGACNPTLAHRALSSDLQVGFLLACNVVVYEDENGAVVGAINPNMMVQLIDNPEMREVAREAGEGLRRAIESI